MKPLKHGTPAPAKPRTHGAELRARLLVCAGAWLALALGILAYKEPVLAYVLGPLQAAGAGHAQATGVGELFLTYLRLAGWGSLLLVMPLVLSQIWAFLAPGLYGHEKKRLRPILLAIPVLFYAGAAFAFYGLLPFMLGYLLGFTQPEVLIQPRLVEYMGFLFTTVMAVGAAFLLPLFLVGLMAAGVLKPASLVAARRWVIVAVFIVAAIVTPPDPFSQTLLALPLLALYEGAILVGRRMRPR